MDTPEPPYLKNLNEAQLKAVTHNPSIPLQILAGPGSGKTRVLTARVAHLVKHHNIPPQRICAVTFTNKAANEMQTRLRPLIGEETTSKLVMGTFHAICGRYLRKHGKKIGLENNFSICDADESKKIVKKILQIHSDAAEMVDLKDSVARSMISNAKSRAQSPAQLRMECLKPEADQLKQVLAEVYEEYEETLQRNNSLDFDDLLVYGVRLFETAPVVLKDIEHILVDEFQDTSVLQYELVKQFAKANNCVTIVGDPDQSIYGWRAAEIENLGKMMRDFDKTEQIFLEENYRSTASILAASHAIVSQDKQRIAKGLFTSHAKGSTPVLRLTTDEHAEADFISGEIKRLMAYSGGMLSYDDFAILLRFNALSRAIEASFQREGIPVRMLAGQKFFDRVEIKDILAYLQLVDNPSFNPAFHRIVNVPARAIGDKSVKDLESLAKSKGWSSLHAAERICQGRVPASDCKASTRLKNQLPAFLTIIRKLRNLAKKGTSVPDLITKLVELIEYEEHLKKSYADWESRWENVQELIKFAQEVSSTANESPETVPAPVIRRASQLVLNDDGSFTEVNQESSDEDKLDEDVIETPLQRFLQASSLSTDTESSDQEADANGAKVTVSTCHAAKGLEWPVVFIPSVEQGTFPFYRTEDIEEERRLLYVACTRAQALLYLTHAKSRLVPGSPRKKKDLSELLTAVVKKGETIIFASETLPKLDYSERKVLCQILSRPIPSDKQVLDAVVLHRPSQRIQDAYHLRSDDESLSSQWSSNGGKWAEQQRKPYSADEGFSRARPEWNLPAFSAATQSIPGVVLPLPSFNTAQSLRATSSSAPNTPMTASQLSIPSVNTLRSKSLEAPRPSNENSSSIVSSKSTSIASYFKPSAPTPMSSSNSALPPSGSKKPQSSNAMSSQRLAQSSGLNSYITARPLLSTNVEERVKENIFVVPVKLGGGKRRLGMGRVPDGFGLGIGQPPAKKARQD